MAPVGDPGYDDDHPDVDFQHGKPNDRDEWESLLAAAQEEGSKTRVEMLERGSLITFRAFWEFVPYNDDPEKEIALRFKNAVKSESTRLLGETKQNGRLDALRRLKATYDQQFGKSSQKRNIISLFLYSGPIYSSWRDAKLHSIWRNCCDSRYARFLSPFVFRSLQCCSILYAGDGYLDTPERLQRMLAFFDRARIDHSGVFQVMHHGASINWHRGVAEAIAPIFSVFSSDPERKPWRHPHPKVLHDFWPYGPIQVDDQSGFAVEGSLRAQAQSR